MTSAWYYRPIADADAATHNSPPWARERVPLLLEWARCFSIGATTLAIRLFMHSCGTYEIEDDKAYRKFLQTVLGGNGRLQDQGLITVSNHRSLFDDPGVVSCLLPLPIAVQPKLQRWGLCSQEYCFNDALPGLVKGYIGAGQVLPICRGGGIDQRALLNFARHLACGEWCHVFPEGGVWQWEELGGRRALPENAAMASSSDFGGCSDRGSQSANNLTDKKKNDHNGGTMLRILPGTLQQRALPLSTKGKLKWGVGKLIAHAPVMPRVIPFAHHGMDRLLPQDDATGRTRLRDGLFASFLPDPRGAKDRLHVRVRFGEEITFDDLVQDHESEHGKLWKYCGKLNAESASAKSKSGEGDECHALWSSSAEERALYSKIVQRIESRLEVITKEVCKNN